MDNTPLQGTISIKTNSSMQLIDITKLIQDILDQEKIEYGVCHLYNPHTTAGLTINEGADPDVQRDIIAGLQHMVPMHMDYLHMEGNSPSHIMASLLGSSLTLLIENSKLILGTWQKVFFGEFDGPRTRKVVYRFSRQ